MYGATQSLTEAQVVRQAPSAQRKGAHSVCVPFGACTVSSSTHCDGTTHLPVAASQRAGLLHSVSAVQLRAQTSPEHKYGAQSRTFGAGHFPLPSQVLAAVATPALQLGAPHTTDEPTKSLQLVRSTPSQAASLQGFCGSPAGQAGRLPWGAPATGTQ